MDMRKYSGAAFLKPGDIKASGPRRVVITDLTEGSTSPIWNSTTTRSFPSTPPTTEY
jgi:hypothetical protein